MNICAEMTLRLEQDVVDDIWCCDGRFWHGQALRLLHFQAYDGKYQNGLE
jgi:hypothetical protein